MAKTNTQQQEDGEIQEPADDIDGKEEKQKPEVDPDNETGGVVVREHIRRPRKERREERQSDEVARLREENERIRREFDSHRQHTELTLQQLRQGTQQIQQSEDPIKSRLRTIRSEQEMLQNQAKQAQNETEVERLKERFYKLSDEADDLREQRISERAALVARREAAQAAQGGQGEEAILRAEFPEILPGPGQGFSEKQAKALRYAHGLYQQMVADDAPATIATSRKAMLVAAEKFGFRQQAAPAPSLAQQQRFGGLPIQAGQQSTRHEVRLNQSQMRMATARWPELAPEEAYAKLAQVLTAAERNGRTDDAA